MSNAAQRTDLLGVGTTGAIQSEVAYSSLRKDIVSCRLEPGLRLRINDIATRIEVSVSAIREALSRLAVEGLVIATAQKGFSVAPISADEIKDLTKTRITIEKLCLIESLKHGNVEWESRVLAAFHRLSRTPFADGGGPQLINEEWIQAHTEFHAALVAACGSPSLMRIWESLYIQTERYRQYSHIVDDVHLRNAALEHQGLMEAALARDVPLINSRIEAHFTQTTNIILQRL